MATYQSVLESRIEKLTERVDDLDEYACAIDARLDDQDLASQLSEIDRMQDKIKRLNDRLDLLTQQFGSYGDQRSVDERFLELEDRLDDLEDRLDDAEKRQPRPRWHDTPPEPGLYAVHEAPGMPTLETVDYPSTKYMSNHTIIPGELDEDQLYVWRGSAKPKEPTHPSELGDAIFFGPIPDPDKEPGDGNPSSADAKANAGELLLDVQANGTSWARLRESDGDQPVLVATFESQRARQRFRGLLDGGYIYSWKPMTGEIEFTTSELPPDKARTLMLTSLSKHLQMTDE